MQLIECWSCKIVHEKRAVETTKCGRPIRVYILWELTVHLCIIKALGNPTMKNKEKHTTSLSQGDLNELLYYLLRVLYDTNEWPTEWMYFANKTQKIFVWSPFPLVCEIVLIQEGKDKLYLQFSDISWNSFGQDLQGFVATSNHCVQAGTLRRTAREWGAAIVIIS